MMDWTLWTAFVAASLVIAVIPGPGVTTIIGYALTGGRKVAFAAVAGAVIGNFVASSLSLAGVGVILAQSALAFTILKWFGAGYLIALGIYSIAKTRNGGHGQEPARAAPIPPRAALWGTGLITALHPKTILFFMAFAPQFISLHHDYWFQAVVLVASFCAVLAITDSLYALGASTAGGLLRGPKVRLWTQRAGGSALILAGVATAASRR